MLRCHVLGALTYIARQAAAFDCSQVDRSTPLAVCCDAQSAWSSMESAGGCGGQGATSEQCSAASNLCRQCRMAVASHTDETGSSAAEGTNLSSLDVSFLEVHCVLPQWQDSCHSVADLGFGVLLVAGGILMLVATGGLLLFDWRALPWMVSRAGMQASDAQFPTPWPSSPSRAEKVGQQPSQIPKSEKCDVKSVGRHVGSMWEGFCCSDCSARPRLERGSLGPAPSESLEYSAKKNRKV